MTTQTKQETVWDSQKGTFPLRRDNEVLTQNNDAVISTGIPGFDESLGQGLPAGNLYLISGSLGSCSTQLAQQILYNTMISKGKVTYYTAKDASHDIINDMKLIDMDIQKYVDDGSWVFGRVIPPKLKKIMDSLPEVPMEQRIDLDETVTKFMNHFHDTVKEGRNTAVHLPYLIQHYPLDEIQNLIFYMTGIVRKHGGIHFLMLTEGAHEQSTIISIKDAVDSVFEVDSTPRGSEMENTINIKKIRGTVPKSRKIKLTQRESGLATETIRRV